MHFQYGKRAGQSLMAAGEPAQKPRRLYVTCKKTKERYLVDRIRRLCLPSLTDSGTQLTYQLRIICSKWLHHYNIRLAHITARFEITTRVPLAICNRQRHNTYHWSRLLSLLPSYTRPTKRGTIRWKNKSL